MGRLTHLSRLRVLQRPSRGLVEPGGFDLVTARAVLHHVADPQETAASTMPPSTAAVANLLASIRPGGAILLVEPDFLPVSVAEPAQVREFWDGWLAWSEEQGIDYTIGRGLARSLAALGLLEIEATAETALYNGGSPWAVYWTQTVEELRERLVESGKLAERSIEAFLAHCADPAWWTQTIAFTAVQARAPGD